MDKSAIRNIIASLTCGYLTYKGQPALGLGALALIADYKAFKERETVSSESPKLQDDIVKKYYLPSLTPYIKKEFIGSDLSQTIETIFNAYDITLRVSSVSQGPILTTYELAFTDAIKITKILKLKDELSISMRVNGLRMSINATSGTISLEVPNTSKALIPYAHFESLVPKGYILPISLGVDSKGNPQFIDLKKLPHLLVSGTTGSGKSVGVNAMICTLLQACTPNDLRLILVDPKKVELSDYQGVPHLLTPIITDQEKALEALKWALGEMENRYHTLSLSGSKNIDSHNLKTSKAMPYIVIVIDEFADLMLSSQGNEIETCVVRLAQKARACGIHLILATQRPTVDVVTGLIKANIAARLSYRVSSKIDSKVILDQQGAESLLGNGDSLFLSPLLNAPMRLHGSYIDEQGILGLVSHWKAQGLPDYTSLTSFVDVQPSQNLSLNDIQRATKAPREKASKIAKALKSLGIINNITS